MRTKQDKNSTKENNNKHSALLIEVVNSCSFKPEISRHRVRIYPSPGSRSTRRTSGGIAEIPRWRTAEDGDSPEARCRCCGQKQKREKIQGCVWVCVGVKKKRKNEAQRYKKEGPAVGLISWTVNPQGRKTIKIKMERRGGPAIHH